MRQHACTIGHLTKKKHPANEDRVLNFQDIMIWF